MKNDFNKRVAFEGQLHSKPRIGIAALRVVPLVWAILALSDIAHCGLRTHETASKVISFWPAFAGLAMLILIGVILIIALLRARRGNFVVSEAVWRSLAENVADIVFVVDSQGRLSYVNREEPEYQSLLGESSEVLVDPLERQRWSEELREVNSKSNREAAIFKMRPPSCLPQFWEVRAIGLDSEHSNHEILICARDVTRAHHRELTREILLNIVNASAASVRLNEFYEVVRHELAKIVDTSNSFLALYHADKDLYSFPMAHDDFTEEELRAGLCDMSGGLTDQVRKSGKALLMNDSTRSALVEREKLRSIGHSARCWLGIPLKNDHEVFGVFVIQSYDDPDAFSNADADLLTIVADSISNAITRKRYSAELTANEARLRVLTERMPALVWSVDSQGQIDFISGAAFANLDLDPHQLPGSKLSEHFRCELGSGNSTPGQTFATGESVEVRLSRGSRTLEGFMELVRDQKGRASGYVGVALDCTERDLITEEMKTYYSLSRECMAIVDMSGQIVRANPAIYSTLGYEESEMIGRSVFDFICPDDAPAAMNELRKAGEGFATILLEARMICKDGGMRWFIWNAMPVGVSGHIYCSGQDITARKANEEALASREEQMRLFVEHAPAAVAMFDADMRYIVASRRWYRDFELPQSSVVGMHHYEVFPELPEKWKEVHRRCLCGASESCADDQFQRRDGRTDWLKWEVRPWYKSGDTIGGIVMFCEVITAQVIAQREIVKARNLAESILNAAPDAVVSVDSEGIVTDWNRHAEEVFGFSREEAIGEFLHHLIIPEDLRSAHARGMSSFRQSGRGHMLDTLHRLEACHKDGTAIPVELSIGQYEVGDETRFAAFLRDIRTQVKREDELRQSRESLAEAQRLAGLGSWEWFPQEDRLVYSKEKRRMTGIPDELQELNTSHYLASIHPDDRDRVMGAMAKGQETRSVIPIEYRIVRPDGTIICVRSQGNVEIAEDGGIARVFGTTWDITAHVEAEAKLRASEERIALALEGSNDGFWDWNVESGDCFFSPRILEWLELDGNTFRHHHQSWEEIVHPEDRNRFFVAFQEHVAHGSSHYEIEERVRTKSGRWIWVLSRGKVVEWTDEGRPLRAAGTWSNITDHKIAEERAVRLGRVVEQSFSEVYMIDPQTMRFIEVNKSACDNLGYSMAELREMTAPQLHADSSSFNPEVYRQLFSGDCLWVEHRFTHRRKDGTTYPLVVKTELLNSADGQMLLAVGLDATEEERAREENERLESKLRQSQRMEAIGTLAGGIAHDFNNILTPILGYADMARLDLEENTRSREDIERVIDAAHRAKGLVQQILAFSRASEYPSYVLRADEVVSDALKLLRVVLPPNIELSQDLEEGLCVRSDSSQLHQIVMNLFTNSVHAIGDRPGKITMTLWSHEFTEAECGEGSGFTPGKWVCLTASDTGCGMTPEALKRIFEPFYTTKTVGQGTGLGLSVVHGLVKSHGGIIQVDSQLNDGTEVRIWIPMCGEAQDADTSQEEGELHGHETILFCDDDEGIAALGKQMLENFGYRVRAFVSASAALSEFEAFRGELQLLIIGDTFGSAKLDLLAAIRNLYPTFPSILLASGAVSDEVTLRHTLTHYKPVTAAELARSVRKAIAIHKSQHEDSRVTHISS